MSTLGDVVVRLRANISDLRRNMDEARRHLRDFQNQVREAGAGLKKIAGLAAMAGAAIGAGLSVLGGLGVKYNADMEQARISFETLLGSAEQAKGLLSELQQFAAQTPFEFPGLQQSAKLMLAMGFNSESIMPSLQAVGDAVAAIGGNQETLNGVTMALGQMMTKGKISAEEMNQLAERGIGGWEILSETMGKSKRELMDMAAQGQLMADVALPKLLEGMQQKYAGAMDAQSKTFWGMLSTLKDNIMMTLGDVTAPVFDKLKEGLADLIETIDELKNNGTLQEWTDKITNAFNVMWTIMVTVGKAFVAVAKQIAEHWNIIGPVILGVAATLTTLKVIGAIITLWGAFRSAVLAARVALIALNTTLLTTPVGWLALAIGALIGAVYALRIAWVNNWGGIQQKTAAVASSVVAFWNLAVNKIMTAFNQLKAGVYKILGGILNAVAPVVDVIGKLAPGFESGFERLRSAVDKKTADVKLNLQGLQVSAQEAAGDVAAAGVQVRNAFTAWDAPAKKGTKAIKQTNDELNYSSYNWNKFVDGADAAGAAAAGAGAAAQEAGAGAAKGAKETRMSWEQAADTISAKLAVLTANYELFKIKLGNNASEAEKLSAELRYLDNQYALQKEVVAQAKAAYESLSKTKGATAKETVEAANKYADEAKSLSELATKIGDTSLALKTMSWDTEETKSRLDVLNAEQERAIANLDESAGKTAELNMQNQYLNQKLTLQAELVADLEREYKTTAEAKGKDAEETRNVYIELVKAQTEQAKLAKEIRDTNKEIADQAREFQELSAKVADVGKSYREDLAKAAEDYYDKVRNANQKLRDDEAKLRDDFKKSLEDRKKSLADFAGLFDQVKPNRVSGAELLGNLSGQVDTFKQWQANLATLAGRGIDEGLLAELEAMGPKAAGEIAALTTLTDGELEQYVALWQEKQQLASDLATQQMEEQRVEMQQKLADLRSDAAGQLEEYRREWYEATSKIKEQATKDLQSIVEFAAKLGADMVLKLAASIRSSMPELSGALSGLGAIIGGDSGQVQAAENQANGMVNAAEGMSQGVIAANIQATQTTLTTWLQAAQEMNIRHEEIKTRTVTTWTNLQTALSSLWAKMLNDVIKTWNDMKKFLFETLTEIDTRFNGMIAKANQWGVSLMSDFIDGIWSQFNRLRSTLETMAEMVDSYMPHSPAKVGPLSRLGETGPGLVKTFADGITASLPYLNRAVGKMAGAAVVPVGFAGGGAYNGSDTIQAGNNFNINITGSNAEEIWEQLERQLIRRGVRF